MANAVKLVRSPSTYCCRTRAVTQPLHPLAWNVLSHNRIFMSTGQGPQGPGGGHVKAGSVATKFISRVFQRVITPEEAINAGNARDLGTDPAVRKVSNFAIGQVKSRTYDKAKAAVLTRLASGFGLILPGLGLYFSSRGLIRGVDRVWDEIGCDRLRSATLFFVSSTADGVNFALQVAGLGLAMRESNLHLPGIHDNPLVWWADLLHLPMGLNLGLAVVSVATGAMGEIHTRYPSVRALLKDKTPSALEQAENVLRRAAQGKAEKDLAGEAVATADTLIDEGLPDLTKKDKATRDAVGTAAAAVAGVSTERAAQRINSAARQAAETLEASVGTSSETGRSSAEPDTAANGPR